MWGPKELDGPRQTQELTLVYKNEKNEKTTTAKPGETLTLEGTITFHNEFQRSLVDTVYNPPEKLREGKAQIFRPSAKIEVPTGFEIKGDPVIQFNNNKKVKTHIVKDTQNPNFYTIYFNYFEFERDTMPADLKAIVDSSFHLGFPLAENYNPFANGRPDTEEQIRAAVGDVPEEGDTATIKLTLKAPQLNNGETSRKTEAYTQSQTWADPTFEWVELSTKTYDSLRPDPTDKNMVGRPELIKTVTTYQFHSDSGYGAWVAGAALTLYGVGDSNLPYPMTDLHDDKGDKVRTVRPTDVDYKGKNATYHFLFDTAYYDTDYFKGLLAEGKDDEARTIQDQNFKDENLKDYFVKTNPSEFEKIAPFFPLMETDYGPGLPVPQTEYPHYGKQPNDPNLRTPKDWPGHQVVPVGLYALDKEFDFEGSKGSMWGINNTKLEITSYFIDNDIDETDGKPVYPPIIFHGGVASKAYARPSETAAIAAPLTIERETPKLKIGNFVFEDNDSNGIYDEGEGKDKPLASVEVKLFKKGEERPLQTQKTDSEGKYLFKDLEPGEYEVRFTTPEGYETTTVADDKHEKPEQDSNRASEGKISVTLEQKDVLWADAGFKKKADETENPPVENKTYTIGNRTFVDENNDGILNGSEKGLDNVTVKLYAGESIEDPKNPLKETKTANNGEYSFTDLNPGKYIVTFETPNGYEVAVEPQMPQDSDDANRAKNGQISVEITNANITTADAGFKKEADKPGEPPVEEPKKPNIGTTVFEDKNNNGKQDEGEPGIPGVVVELNKNGEPYLSTKTDDNGEYEFPNLDPDTKYTVIFKTPDGYTPTIELNDPKPDVNSNRAKEGKIEVDLKKDPVKTADAGFKKTPVVPENPVTPPVNPENPEVPVKPIKPSHPKQPPEFFKPLIPCQPGKPCDPEKPGKPVKTTQPKQPAKPGQELPKTGEQATATGAYALAVALMALAAYGVVLKQRKA